MADTEIIASADTYIDEQWSPLFRDGFAFVQVHDYAGDAAQEPLLQFDITSLVGKIWDSAVLRLVYTQISIYSSQPAYLQQTTKTPLDIPAANWTHYDYDLDPAGTWTQPGARSKGDSDTGTAVQFALDAHGSGDIIFSPDITNQLRGALDNQAGIYQPLIYSRAPSNHRWHSIDQGDDNIKPTVVLSNVRDGEWGGGSAWAYTGLPKCRFGYYTARRRP